MVGCSTLQNWKAKFNTSKNTPSSKAKVESKDPAKLNWETSALFQEGTKPLLIGTQVDVLQNGNGKTLPCIDVQTGNERKFLLADLEPK